MGAATSTRVKMKTMDRFMRVGGVAGLQLRIGSGYRTQSLPGSPHRLLRLGSTEKNSGIAEVLHAALSNLSTLATPGIWGDTNTKDYGAPSKGRVILWQSHVECSLNCTLSPCTTAAMKDQQGG